MDGFCQGVSQMTQRSVASTIHTAADLDVYRRVNEERVKVVRYVERYTDVVINAPPQGQFHSRPYVIGLAVGIPVDPVSLAPRKLVSHGSGGVHILHSPSFHIGKGTEEIRAAIKSLKEEGMDISYHEISNRPNMEVRQAIVECDFVVDQVYSDSPMAGFAAEAALAGKPAVVCGYYSDFYENDLPEKIRPPSLYCHPRQLKEAIRKLVCDATFRRELGKEAQNFVQSNWSPRKVAERYLLLARGEIPDEWVYSPERNQYFLGMGLEEGALHSLIQDYLRRFGPGGLGLDANLGLREKVVEFSNNYGSESPCISRH